MINIGSSSFQCNNLFFQPTWTCAKNCQGCYLKEKESTFDNHFQMNRYVWADIINDCFFEQKFIAPNEITFALDTLPKEESSRKEMLYLAHSLYENLQFPKKIRNAQVHVTTNSYQDIYEYVKEFGDDIYNYNRFNYLDMLSISNIQVNDLDKLKENFPNVPINWNIMSSTFVKMFEKSPDSVIKILKYINTAYVLLHKEPLGLEGHNYNDFFRALEVIKSIKGETPVVEGEHCNIPSLTDKIHLDGCMNDAAKFNKTGNGCTSNISRFQIWPDGRVTGCAYNSKEQYGNAATTISDVVVNLQEARKRYEFERCGIPSGLKNYGKNKLKVI